MDKTAGQKIHDTEDILRRIAKQLDQREAATCCRVSWNCFEVAAEEVYREVTIERLGRLMRGPGTSGSPSLHKVRLVHFISEGSLRDHAPFIWTHHPHIRTLTAAGVEVDMAKKEIWLDRHTNHAFPILPDESNYWPDGFTIRYNLYIQGMSPHSPQYRPDLRVHPAVVLDIQAILIHQQHTGHLNTVAPILQAPRGTKLDISRILNENLENPSLCRHRIASFSSWIEPMSLPLTWTQISQLRHLRSIAGVFDPPATATDILQLIQSRHNKLEMISLRQNLQTNSLSISVADLPEILAATYDQKKMKMLHLTVRATASTARQFKHKAQGYARKWWTRGEDTMINLALNLEHEGPDNDEEERQEVIRDLARGYVKLFDGAVVGAVKFFFSFAYGSYAGEGPGEPSSEFQEGVRAVILDDAMEDLARLFGG